MEDEVSVLDPLFARTRAERLATRQIYEPLVSDERGPFGVARSIPGLAKRVVANEDETVWTIALRRGIKFQSGEALDAAAVLLNVARWRRIDSAARLIGEVEATDSPRPGLVRFIYPEPQADVERALANPRLGIVAPSAIRQAGDAEIRPGPTGCGPFEYRGRTGDRFSLARSIGWWGEEIGLGPGVDQVELEWVPRTGDRLAGLLSGTFDVADELGAAGGSALEDHSLLATIGAGAKMLGIDRAVRGFGSVSATQSLTDVWLTDLR